MPKHTSKYEIVYEEPAPAPNARSGSALYNILSEIVKDNKGEYAKIVTFTSRTGANSLVNRINQGKTRLPAERENFKFTCRSNAETNESYLFVLYNADGFDDERDAVDTRRRNGAGKDETETPKPARRARKAAATGDAAD